MNNTVVYRHRKKDTLDVFYIGIGSVKRRPYVDYNRNKMWTNIYNKYGRDVDILAENLSWEDACELEELLIEEYGRRDLGHGCLANCTNGGDGNCGKLVSKETREKMSKVRKGRKLSEEAKKNMSNGRLGMKFSETHKSSLKKARNNRPHKSWYKIYDSENDVYYNNLNDLSNKLGLKYNTLYMQIKRGNHPNFKLIKTTKEAQEHYPYIN